MQALVAIAEGKGASQGGGSSGSGSVTRAAGPAVILPAQRPKGIVQRRSFGGGAFLSLQRRLT